MGDHYGSSTLPRGDSCDWQQETSTSAFASARNPAQVPPVLQQHRFCQGRAGLALTKTLTETIMRKAGTVPFEMYDNSSYYDVLDRAKRETGSNPMHMLLYSLWFLQAGLGVISMLGAVLAFHRVAGLVVVATALPGIVFQYKVAHRSWRVMNDTTPATGRSMHSTPVAFCAMSPFKSSRNHLRCCPLFFLIVGSSIAADTQSISQSEYEPSSPRAVDL